jgi:alpha-tubulin suppressor-like RCC1 family protein
VDADQAVSCAIKLNGGLYCWGKSFTGQTGVASGGIIIGPSHVAPGTKWLAVSTASTFTVATRTDHTLWAWGDNNHGNLGTGAGSPSVGVPAQVGTDADWAYVGAAQFAYNHACAAKTGGEIWCWGANNNGEVGNNTTEDQPSPVKAK